MKTYKHLFEKIISFENLLRAGQKAQRGKRYKPATARFNLDLEKELLQLQRELSQGRYRHGAYVDFVIHDPKQRLISAAPYRDRVVHHALCNIIEPIFDKTFIYDTYACRKGKGTHAAIDRYSCFARKNRYVLKCDIRKYFQSIDHEILLNMVAGKIRCPKTMALIRKIVGSRQDRSVVFYFPGDDIFAPYLYTRAIPIGNLTSQFFANLYLSPFDHYIKEQLRCRFYIRYVATPIVYAKGCLAVRPFSGAGPETARGTTLRTGRSARPATTTTRTTGTTMSGFVAPGRLPVFTPEPGFSRKSRACVENVQVALRCRRKCRPKHHPLCPGW